MTTFRHSHLAATWVLRAAAIALAGVLLAAVIVSKVMP